jgi:hypothetical protein
LRHVDADRAAQMILERDLTFACHVEARLERASDDEAEPCCATFISECPKHLEARRSVFARSPALIETRAQVRKGCACRRILRFEPDNRTRRDAATQGRGRA